MDNVILNQKGQVAIEYIVFIAIFLLFFQTAIKPSIDFAENILNDTYAIVETHNNIENLSQTIEGFSNSLSYGTRTMFFYLPNNSKIIDCNNNGTIHFINYQIQISDTQPNPTTPDCNTTTDICTYSKQIFIGEKNLDCQPIGPGYSGPIILNKSQIGDISVSIE